MGTKETIDSIFQQKKLKLRENLKENFPEGLFIYAVESDTGKELFKAVEKKHQEKYLSFQRECLANDFLLNKIKEEETFWPAVIEHGETEEIFWMRRNFIEGQTLSDISDLKATLYGYDRIKSDYRSQAGELLPKIVRRIDQLQDIPITIEDKGNDLFAYRRFKLDIEEYNLAEVEKGIGCDLALARKIYAENKSEFFGRNVVLATNDMVPANVIVTGDHGVYLSDFEFLNLENRMMDISYLWLFLWRFPDWQQSLAELAVKSKENELDFRLSCMRQIVHWFHNVYPKYTDERGANPYDGHVWARYLLAAAESFEALINTK